METNNTIPIFFTLDDTYAPFLSAALVSLKENASKEYNYKIHIIYQELNEKNKKRLTKFADEKFNIELVYMEDEFEEIKRNEKGNYLNCNYFTLSIFYRLFIADMFPQYDKGIYIDSDVVVPGDISEMYNIDLGDNIIGACRDKSIAGVEPLMYYLEEYVGVNRNDYINSGVLLMNLKQMREKKFTERFLTLLNKYQFDCLAPDQDYINAICNGKILYLDEEWDSMPLWEKGEDLEKPKIIHYNLFKKPWCYDNIQYEDYFWKYVKQTDYYDEVVEFKNNYSDEQKKNDEQSLERLVSLGTVLPNNEFSFKKVFDRGENVRL